MEAACDTSPLSPAAAKSAFANRSAEFRKIAGADVYSDCLHLFNETGQRLVLSGIGLSPRPTKGSRVVVDILSAAGFGVVVDDHGHSLRSIIELGCCGGGTMSFTELDGVVSVFRHPQ